MSTAIRTLDPNDQRRKALRQANAVRRRRRETRDAIKQMAPPSSARAVCEIMLGVPDWAASMHVARLLHTINGFGSVRVRRIVGTNANMPLAKLDATARAAIAKRAIREASHLKKRGGAPRVPLSVDHYAQAQEALQTAQRIRLARAHTLMHIASSADLSRRAARAAALVDDSERDTDLDGLTLIKILQAVFGRHDERVAHLVAELHLRPTTKLGMLSTPRIQQTAAAIRVCHNAQRGVSGDSCLNRTQVGPPLARAA
jgi:hypothetical protein